MAGRADRGRDGSAGGGRTGLAALRKLSARPLSREAVETVRERDTARSGDRTDPDAGHPRRVPVLTAIALTATLLGTLTRLSGSGVFDALRRDPTELDHGQLWRLLTPVLVQGDHSLIAIVGVFVLCAVIGVAGEWLLPRSEWLLLYLFGALAGHGIGETFQPHQSGTSVAFAGILGGLGARILLDHGPQLKFWRMRFAALIPLAILDTALRDIHGSSSASRSAPRSSSAGAPLPNRALRLWRPRVAARRLTRLWRQTGYSSLATDDVSCGLLARRNARRDARGCHHRDGKRERPARRLGDRFVRAVTARPELAAEVKALLPDEFIDELLAGAKTEEEIAGRGGLLGQLTNRVQLAT